MALVQTPSFNVAVYQNGNPAAGKLAIVIPGRLDTKDYISMRSLVDYLANRGYLALSFDPPGTWESPGDISLYSTTTTLRAIDELIEYFGNKPTVLIGHSRGGSNAMLAGTKNPYVTHIIAIMSHAGPTTVDLPIDGSPKMSYRDVPPGATRTKKQKEFALPASYFEDQANYDATEALKTCKKPKLFFYGTDDTLVSEASVKSLFAITAEPKMIHALNSEHDYRLHSDIIEEVNETIGSFLNS